MGDAATGLDGKHLIIDPDTRQVSPFLRPVLIRSLVAVGLSFSAAAKIAKRVRKQLGKTRGPVPKARLRKWVATDLEKRFGKGVRRAYIASRDLNPPKVMHPGRHAEPFSIVVLTRHLEGCGIPYDQASRGVMLVRSRLRKLGDPTIDHLQLRRIVVETLQRDCCEKAAERFISRCRQRDSGTPLIVLIGGASGTGKSMVASRLAYLLEIERTQSTDMLREIARCYLSPQAAPTLGYSSCDAWRGLGKGDRPERNAPHRERVVSGFLAQFATVKVALEATMNRAAQEHQDIIFEGVHALPSLLETQEIASRALVVPCMVAVRNKARLVENLNKRTREQPARPSKRQLKQRDAIWQLQTYMMDQARRDNIPIIMNHSIDDNVRDIIDVVMRKISERFSPSTAADPQSAKAPAIFASHSDCDSRFT